MLYTEHLHVHEAVWIFSFWCSVSWLFQEKSTMSVQCSWEVSRMIYSLSTFSQGPQPQQGDPAAAGPPCWSTAPHFQCFKGSPDGERSAASVGGGCCLKPPTPTAACPEGGGGGEEDRVWAASGVAPCCPGSLGDTQRFVRAGTHSQKHKENHQKKKKMTALGHSVSFGYESRACLRSCSLWLVFDTSVFRLSLWITVLLHLSNIVSYSIY